MVFCNKENGLTKVKLQTGHNPYFNRWFSAMNIEESKVLEIIGVTILILIDGFLQ